jgi:NAD(P)-dependent dehydrogenase (short-subunit alcohol dehydrogenase family)
VTSGTRQLEGRTAIVTGAGRGIGEAIALALGAAGADIVLAARSRDQIDLVATHIETQFAVQTLAVPTDVTSVDAVESMTQKALDRFGKIDILVNNSGVVCSKDLLDTTDDDWDRVIATNLRGAFLTTRAAGRCFVEQRSGKVINVASNFAFRGFGRHAAYCASKAGIVALTKAIAVEWARFNIQVNALAPGYVATDLNSDVRADPAMMARITKAVPARRMAHVDELCPWAVLLASPASDFMTGETIVIDGGQTA